MISIDMKLNGPVLKGRGPVIAQEYLDDVKEAVAHQGYADVMGYLNAQIKHPTPYYEVQIIAERVGSAGGDWIVHDRGIIYGPWLEGVSHRNQTTRFKGYHSFRKALQDLSREVNRIADMVWRQTKDRFG